MGLPAVREVRVSTHAMERLEERGGVPWAVARREVREALGAGRTALRMPAWAVEDGRARPLRVDRRHDRRAKRWVWSEGLERAYLVAVQAQGVVVVVTMVPAAVGESAA